MTNELKVYEQITIVKLMDWSQITTPISVEDLLKATNSWLKFIKIWWKLINVNTISQAEEKKGNTIDNFILSFDPEIQDRLNSIKQEKLTKKEKLNIDTLRNAYKRIYNEEL